MVACSHQSFMSRDGVSAPEKAVLLWAVVEALEDLPATPEAQRQYEGARGNLGELLDEWATGLTTSQQTMNASTKESSGGVVELLAMRNHGERWSGNDLVKLRNLAGSLPTRVISLRLGRTEQSVRSKACAENIKLGLHRFNGSDPRLKEGRQ